MRGNWLTSVSRNKIRPSGRVKIGQCMSDLLVRIGYIITLCSFSYNATFLHISKLVSRLRSCIGPLASHDLAWNYQHVQNARKLKTVCGMKSYRYENSESDSDIWVDSRLR